MNLNKIKTNINTLLEYINILNKMKGKHIDEVISKAQYIVPDLRLFNSEYKIKDKGSNGKKIEESLFGNKPNNISEPDLPFLGIDIKATKFKKLKNLGYNAKERLTLTNIGASNDINSFNNIINNTLEECKAFKKFRKILLIVTDLDNKLLGIVLFEYEKLSEEYKKQIQDDYLDIQTKIKNNEISQKGQEFLHIHSHGSKKSFTKALGFKNRFITKIFGELCNYDVIETNNNCYLANNSVT